MSVCGITYEDGAYCWGYNFFGTLGDGTVQRRLTPVPVSGGLTFQSLSVGYETTCGLTNLGAGFCWGYNFGALGDGTSTHRSIPGAIFGGFKFWNVSAGTGYSCGVTTDNMVLCWGSNTNGELGDGTTDERLTPTLVRWPSG
jgi:alpha-tubulin suppressor-like RCC1 family protein